MSFPRYGKDLCRMQLVDLRHVHLVVDLLSTSRVMISSLHSRWQVSLSASRPELKSRHSIHSLQRSENIPGDDISPQEKQSKSSIGTTGTSLMD